MPKPEYQVYRYRWVVLMVFMFIIAVTQMLWISFAPVTSKAAAFYGVSDLMIGLLSMSFMIVYIIVSIPASWVIDTYGIRVGVGIGAVLTGVFGLMRGLFPANFGLVMAAQIGIGIGQPFVLNAITKVAAQWFPLPERATASGLGMLAAYLGIIAAMFITPALTLAYSLSAMLAVYGVTAGLAAAVFLLFARERPPSPPCPQGHEERALMFDGLKSVLRQRDFLMLLGIFFVGLGIFNGVTTWIEEIIRPRGFTVSQAGVLGGLTVVGGVIGAVILPPLSDRFRRRKPFILLALIGAIPGLAGLTFATNYGLLLLSGFTLGFFLLAAGPIGFQYGAELTHPAPEGTSNGLLLMMGQIAGIIYIFAMDAFKSPATGAMTGTILVSLGLLVVCCFVGLGLRESVFLQEETETSCV